MTADTNSAKAQERYLLSAELAQLKEYDRAAEEMAAALDLDPSLLTARFQLGLLHLTQSRPQEAMEVWEPLEELDDTAALKFLKRGMEALIHNEFSKCIQLLQKGIALNIDNAPLNNDMRLVIRNAAAAVEGGSPSAQHNGNDSNEEERVHTDFSLYGSKNN